jgi:hypothetical protein
MGGVFMRQGIYDTIHNAAKFILLSFLIALKEYLRVIAVYRRS